MFRRSAANRLELTINTPGRNGCIMTQGDILTICKDSVTTALMIAAPFLVLSLIIGLVISVLQAATQIHEQTITFVPKILSVALILIFLGSWIMNMMIGFTEKIFIYISNLA